jgi:DNA/RNA endonuclease YhcR with UshA esterase domain
VTFIDMGGVYPTNIFTAVIFSNHLSAFPDLRSLGGKTVDVTGAIRLHKGKPEIILNSADQLRQR